MEKRPTFREKVLAVFQGKNTNNIPWQPRLEHWFNVNRARNQLVEPYQSMKLLDLYKNLNCSVRYYYGEAQDISSPNTFIHFDYPPGAGIFEFQQGDDIKVIFRSAKGEELIGKKRLGEWGCSWHYIEHPVKNIEDLRVLEDIVTSVSYRFDKDFYLEAKKAVGEWGEIQFYWERSPFQRLFLQYAGIENTIQLIYDYPSRLQEYLKKAEEAEDSLFEILASCPVKILNFGENIDGRFNSPRIFNQFLVPYYQKRVQQLHKSGKFCHIHMDGSLKPLLPYLRDSGFDGIEGATPQPQGDVSLEELKGAMGEMILIDGIPMLLFLPEYPLEELESFTKKVLSLFSPRLILGISDEISPQGDIEKVRFVSKFMEINQGGGGSEKKIS
jgi:hypothetical protein